MLKKYIMMFCVFASLLAMPTLAGTHNTFNNGFVFQPVFDSGDDYIKYFASKYNANEKQLLTVAWCESGYKQHAIGDGGRAVGIFQYHKPTWDRYSGLMGEELDYYSVHDQAKLTAFIWVNYPKEKRAWTCATKNGIA